MSLVSASSPLPAKRPTTPLFSSFLVFVAMGLPCSDVQRTIPEHQPGQSRTSGRDAAADDEASAEGRETEQEENGAIVATATNVRPATWAKASAPSFHVSTMPSFPAAATGSRSRRLTEIVAKDVWSSR